MPWVTVTITALASMGRDIMADTAIYPPEITIKRIKDTCFNMLIVIIPGHIL